MIEGRRIVLRAVEKEDIARWRVWFNDPEVRRNVHRVYPYSTADGEQFYEFQRTSETDKVFAIDTLEGEHIGSIGLHHLDWVSRHAELGVLIGEPEYRGRGYGTDAITTLLGFAFGEMNLHRVQLWVLEFNARGLACYRKCGFKQEGVSREAHFSQGRYWDFILMGILASEFTSEQRTHHSPG